MQTVHTWFEVQDHVQGLAVVRDLLIESCQVKLVLDVVLIHLKFGRIG